MQLQSAHDQALELGEAIATRLDLVGGVDAVRDVVAHALNELARRTTDASPVFATSEFLADVAFAILERAEPGFPGGPFERVVTEGLRDRRVDGWPELIQAVRWWWWSREPRSRPSALGGLDPVERVVRSRRVLEATVMLEEARDRLVATGQCTEAERGTVEEQLPRAWAAREGEGQDEGRLVAAVGRAMAELDRATREGSPQEVRQRKQSFDRKFAELDRALRPLVRRWAVVYLGRSPQDAEDCAQEVLLKVHLHIGELRGPGAAAAWIFRMTANAAISVIRSRRARPDLGEPVELDTSQAQHSDTPEDLVDTRRALACALDLMGPTERETFLLRFAQGLEPVEIMKLFGKSRFAVDKLLSRAMGKVIESLDGCPIGPSRNVFLPKVVRVVQQGKAR